MSAPQQITTPYVPPARPVLIAGNGGLPKLMLRSRDGASAEVYLHGGQVTSWLPAGESEDRLFLSESARFQEGEAIRGGVPVIFPQFGAEGRLPRHGFARATEWGLLHARETAAGAASVTLQLTDSRASWALWRHRFSLELTVTVQARNLDMRLTVVNDGRKPFRFTGALHTYLRVRELTEVSVEGLEGCRFKNQLSGDEQLEQAGELRIPAELDRIYFKPPQRLRLNEPGRSLEIACSGFTDTVVWNPGPVQAARMEDLEAGGDRHMLCLEPAVIAEPVWLPPGAAWVGTQRLSA